MPVNPSKQQHPIVADLLARLDEQQHEQFQERAGILTFDAGMDRQLSEALAMLDLIRLNPLALSGIAVLQIELDGGTEWLLTVFQLHWKMSGFGMIQKPEDPVKNYVTRFYALNENILEQIGHSLKIHKGSKLIYVNRIYVVKSATVSTKKGVKTAAGSEVTAAVVTAGGAYTYSQDATANTTHNNIVLNLEGEELSLMSVNPTRQARPAAKNNIVTTLSPALKSMMLEFSVSDRVVAIQPFTAQSKSLLVPTGKKMTIPTHLIPLP